MDSSKKPTRSNPRQSANILSQLIFAWTFPILYKGSKVGISTDDLTTCLKADCSEELGDQLEDEWYKEIERSHRNSTNPKLRNAIFRTFWKPAFVDGLICLFYITIKSIIPAALAQLLFQFQKSSVSCIILNNTISYDANFDTECNISSFASANIEENDVIYGAVSYMWNDIYCLGAILILSTLMCCFILHHVDLRQRLMGARMRIACCSLIYRKTLCLSMKTVGKTPAGYLINLLSNDVNRLDYGFIFMHWIWILPIQAILICYLIWTRIGIAALVGVIGLLLKTIPVQTLLSKISSKLRMKIAERTDVRVGIMSELIQGIQVIKMYAWEKPFQAVVAEARRREIKQIRYASYLRGFYLSTMVFTERSTLYITIAAAVILGNTISADIVFSAAGYFNILQLVAAIWYPLAVSFGAEALVSLTRIQNFLQFEARDEKILGFTHKPDLESDEENKTIVMKEINACWDSESPVLNLQSINLKITKGQLCAIIGPVGAGKSSLLQLLLGELPIVNGNLLINGSLSYASQEPWLFTGSVRKNIIFGEEYDRKRYSEITKCCALRTDFEQLSNGDKTIVGERGASLSGGQRARISLARAVYKKASIYLLDDPLSAVDAHVGRHLFDEVIGPKSRLANEKATRILVTHQIHFLTEADWIVIIDNGKILCQGSYSDLVSTDLDFAKLLQRPNQQEKVDFQDDVSIISDFEDDIPYIDGVHEGYKLLRRNSTATSLNRKSMSLNNDFERSKENIEDKGEGGISMSIWLNYFRAGSTLMGFSFMVFVMILSQVVCSGSDYFVNIWTQQEHLRSIGKDTDLTTFECLYIYGALIVGVIVMTVFRGFIFFKICMHASKVLHDNMFCAILHATLRFFDLNPSGRILNRFSRDMGAIDELLPRAMMDFIQIALVMIGILIVISVVNPILLIAVVVVSVIDTLILRLYLQPSQDLKRLEGICRSPIFSHLSATLSGLAVIRSRKLQNIVIKEFDNLQNTHSAVWQLIMSSNTALGLWLDCASCCFLTTVTFSFIFFSNQTYSGNVGLAISQAMILTGMVQYGVRQVAETLQQLTSVERVIEYTHIELEENKSGEPPSKWPTHGQIEFRNMYCSYDPNGPVVLKEINIVIEPTSKVGIVGRTGAGKSSMIGALFRLANIKGAIYIDGIETGTIPLESLRSHISIIPQDPVLFSETIRYNLDPFKKFTDADIWRALEDVELKSAIPGLDFMVTERGSNFSVGQRQLLCLARAILRNNKVLVLDEATANVDPQTDLLIQHTIRHKFKNCTVMTVAHRLHTVMDSDRIIVMDAGYVKEYDTPYNLLRKPKGILRGMVEATGSEAKSLKKIANETYKNANLYL